MTRVADRLPRHLFLRYCEARERHPGRRCRSRLTKTLFRRARALERLEGPFVAAAMFRVALKEAHLVWQMLRAPHLPQDRRKRQGSTQNTNW